MKHTRKVGTNRGKARIWLEGKELLAFGIKHGQRFNVHVIATGLIIEIDPDGKRKIAGTKARPIIDMTGRIVEAGGFAAGDTFAVTRAKAGGIKLERVE